VFASVFVLFVLGVSNMSKPLTLKPRSHHQQLCRWITLSLLWRCLWVFLMLSL